MDHFPKNLSFDILSEVGLGREVKHLSQMVQFLQLRAKEDVKKAVLPDSTIFSSTFFFMNEELLEKERKNNLYYKKSLNAYHVLATKTKVTNSVQPSYCGMV